MALLPVATFPALIIEGAVAGISAGPSSARDDRARNWPDVFWDGNRTDPAGCYDEARNESRVVALNAPERNQSRPTFVCYRITRTFDGAAGAGGGGVVPPLASGWGYAYGV